MSAPSLAGEIAQLHELFKLGALTEAEFNAAKQATLQSFLAKSSAAPAAPQPGVTPQPSSIGPPPEAASAGTAAEASPSSPTHTSAPTAAPARTRAEWQQLWSTSPVTAESAGAPVVDVVDRRVQALRCAERLLRNLAAHPAEPKYRRLRETNKVIAQELVPVEASAALLRFAGFARKSDAAAEGGTATTSPAFVWVQQDDPVEAAKKAVAAGRLVSHLLDYMGEQQARRFGLQQLWRSVALEVRLERAAREAAATPGGPLAETSPAAGEAEEDVACKSTRPHPFLDFLVECYTLDEAGDGLYSAREHLRTLLGLYTAALTPSTGGGVSSPSSTSHALLQTAEVYGAVVQQRGAIELLLHGCSAHLHPSPSPVALHDAQASSGSSSGECVSTGDMYALELLPPELLDRQAHLERCVVLLQRLLAEVERVRQQRAAAARATAENSMRQELRRERQRQQLEQGRVRGDAEASSQVPRRRARQQRSTSSASSSSSDSSPTAPATGAEGRRRIPIAEALAVLMGKRSPPQSRPPAASSSPSP